MSGFSLLPAACSKNLPDSLNPVFVKELRQTLYNSSFYGITIMLLGAELLVFFLEMNFSASTYIYDLASFLNFFVSYTWPIAAALMLSTVIGRWSAERSLDALAPENASPLSTFTILRGKFYLLLALLAWIVLTGLPFMLWALPKLPRNICFSVPPIATLTFLCVLAFAVWNAAAMLCTRPKRNERRGFSAPLLLLGTIFLGNLPSHLLDFPLSHECVSATETALYNDMHYNINFQLCGADELFIYFYAAAGMLAYGLLILYGLMLPRHSNRFFIARFWGLFLLAGGICGLYLFSSGIYSFRPEHFLAGAFAAGTGYLIFQVAMTVCEPLATPARMKLDAPAAPAARAIWNFCGAGMLRAWIYTLTLFAAAVAVLRLQPQPKHFDSAWGTAGAMLIISSYTIIYGLIITLIRRLFPKANGFALLAILTLGLYVVSFIFSVSYPRENISLLASISPLGYIIRNMPELSNPDSWAAARYWFMAPVYAVGLFLVLTLFFIRSFTDTEK